MTSTVRGIPGTANDALPDSTMHYVPFTYAGTVDAYKLTSEMATTEEYAQQNEYAHSLFVADYAVTHAVSWDNLNAEKLIFGKDYATGSVEYTIRVPSGGSAATGMFHYSPGTPQSNEWDRILDKNGGYIKNCSKDIFLGTRYFTLYGIEPCGSRVRFAPQICRLQYYA